MDTVKEYFIFEFAIAFVLFRTHFFKFLIVNVLVV